MTITLQDDFKLEYSKHQVIDNYRRFLVIPIITGLLGLAFLLKNTVSYLNSEVVPFSDHYFWLWLTLTLSSIIFRVFISTINRHQNIKLLDYSMMMFTTVLCCLAAVLSALDSTTSPNYTAYAYTILGMATAYRASVRKYLIISITTFAFFNYLYFYELGNVVSFFFLFPIIALNILSVFIATSIENNRRTMILLSKELERTNLKLREESIRDPLTKLYNRRYLIDYLERAIKDFSRSDVKFCVAMCDLDHFKVINDQLGHLVGDEALVSFSAAIQDIGRDTDIQVRFGGEEFVILMPNTNIEQASILVERIRASIKTYVFKDVPWCLTVSFGLTEITPDDDYTSILARADKLVYQAKEEGRNKVVIG